MLGNADAPALRKTPFGVLEKLVPENVASPTEKLFPSSAGNVTLEDVKRVVEKLKAAGKRVSTGTVHAELGRGSKTTICKHYAALRLSGEISAIEVAAPLPPALLADIGREIERLVKARTSQLSDELEDAQRSLLAVVAESEGYRAAAGEAESRAAALQLSIAEQAGVLETLHERAESLAAQIVQLGEDAERARQSLAISQERLRVAEDHIGRLESEQQQGRTELIEARAASAKLREQLDVSITEGVSLRMAAETGRQVAERLEDALREQSHLQSQLADSRSSLASSEAQRQGLAERLKDAQIAQNRAEATCKQLLQKVLGNCDNLTEQDKSNSSTKNGEQKGLSK